MQVGEPAVHKDDGNAAGFDRGPADADKHNHQALLDASFGLDIPSQANDETKLNGHSHSFQHAICAQIRETRQKLKALLAQLSSFRCTCLGTNSLSLPDDDYQNSTLGQIDHSSVNDGQGCGTTPGP